MARHVTIRRDDRLDVVTVYEEGFKAKAVKREIGKSFHMNTLHQDGQAYEYADNTFKYIKGDRKNVK